MPSELPLPVWPFALKPPKKTAQFVKSARRLSSVLSPAESPEPPLERDFSEDEDFEGTATNGSSVSGPDTTVNVQWTTLLGQRTLVVVRRAGIQLWTAAAWPSLRLSVSLSASQWKADIVQAHLLPAPPADSDLAPKGSKAWAMAPLLLVVTASEGASVLHIHSLRHGSTVKQIPLPATCITAIKSNNRFLAISCQSPPSIHVLSIHTLAPLPFSPLCDMASDPVWDLGPSRFLAYASTEAQPHYHGSGIAPSRSCGQDCDDQAGLDTRDSLTRAVASSVFSGVKALGELGYSYLAAQRHPHPSQHQLSKSAPLATTIQRTSSNSLCSSPYIKVVDLAAGALPTAHFRPSSNPVSIISLDPSGSLILTSPLDGQTCHIFEFRPAPKLSKMRHRYQLLRGFTPAHIRTSSWAPDSSSVAIGTASGTYRAYLGHAQMVADLLYADIFSLLAGSSDAQNDGSASIAINPQARMRPPSRHSFAGHKTSKLKTSLSAPPVLVWLPQRLAQQTIDHMGLHTTSKGTSEQQFIAVYPHLDALVLYDLTSHAFLPTSPTISGLTAMLQGLSPDGKSSAQATSVFAVSAQAAWPLVTSPNAPSSLPPPVAVASSMPTTKRNKWLSEAELQTFSPLRSVHPRSLYLSHQFNYFHYAHDFDSAAGQFDPACTPVAVRREVEDTKPPRPDQLESALQSNLDLLPTQTAPHHRAPAFGNGWSGKQGSWKPSIPVRAISIAPKLQQVRERGWNMATSSSPSRDGPISLSFEEAKDTLLLSDASNLDDDVPGLDHTSSSASDPASQDLRDSWAHWASNESLDLSPLPSPCSPAVPQADQLVEPFTLDEDLVSQPTAGLLTPEPIHLPVPTGPLASLGISSESGEDSASSHLNVRLPSNASKRKAGRRKTSKH